VSDNKLSKPDLLIQNAALKRYCADLHWMARRYVDGRSSYAPSMFNGITRGLLSMGVQLNATGDGIIWARDGMGRGFDKLSEAEATPGTPEAKGERS
jgi:hypothetical protein